MLLLAGAVLMPCLLHVPDTLTVLKMKALMVLLAWALLLKRVFRKPQVISALLVMPLHMHGRQLAHLPHCWCGAVAKISV